MAPFKNHFKKQDEELAKYAKALSAPAKVTILKTLAKHDTCICGEIVEITPLAQSTVSQHLKELKDLGLIQGTVDGARSCYCLDPDGVLKFRKLFEAFINEIGTECKDCAPNKQGEYEKRRD